MNTIIKNKILNRMNRILKNKILKNKILNKIENLRFKLLDSNQLDDDLNDLVSIETDEILAILKQIEN